MFATCNRICRIAHHVGRTNNKDHCRIAHRTRRTTKFGAPSAYIPWPCLRRTFERGKKLLADWQFRLARERDPPFASRSSFIQSGKMWGTCIKAPTASCPSGWNSIDHMGMDS